MAMCVICSRRALIIGAMSTFMSGPAISSAAQANRQIACGFTNEDLHKVLASRTSMPSGDSSFHRALVAELKNILKTIPVQPGFQYVDARNAFAVPDTYVPGTSGTVLIGVSLVRDLLKPDDGGISVAGVLAHECAHIFQYFSSCLD